MKLFLINWTDSLRHAVPSGYSQIFFSNNKWFALLLLLATFMDPFCGISGFVAVLVTVAAAKILGLNAITIRSGLYSFNSLLVGLMMGHYYVFSFKFFIILSLISFLTLLLTIWFENSLSKSGLPFLSLPFMISVWVVLLCSRSFTAIASNERGLFMLNDLWNIGGKGLVTFYEKINSLKTPLIADVYFRSLGAIFFESNIITGILIAAGLLFWSRIAFILSLAGFACGYFFYLFMQGDFSDIQYGFIGFNFILSAIALGGFFTIPSASSFILVLLITPVTGILSSALLNLLEIWQLPVYSLPFNLIVLLMLLVLKFRAVPRKPELTVFQFFSPEKNLYQHRNRLERFKNDTYFHIHLPFFGEWHVSQGHDGKITHKGDWQYAWDFVVKDETGKTYRPPGTAVTDFYCYNLPVLAPGAGYVVSISDEVDDNAIGDVDIAQNWGNSIVIRHSDYLYSKISHILKNSFKVKPGDYVKKGDIIALCGNSGRSPEPHVHFQLQATPHAVSKTIKYPVSYFITSQNGHSIFHAFDYPEERENISIVQTSPLIREAFHFIPGAVLNFNVKYTEGRNEKVQWEVFVDANNIPYIFCHNTKSYAYFTNNETLHYFTAFHGDKNSLLYYFYLGAYKILLGYYSGMEISDRLPAEGFYNGFLKFAQDFIAPFYLFLKTEYSSCFHSVDDIMNPGNIEIRTNVTAKAGAVIKRNVDFSLILKGNKINTFTIAEKNNTIIAKAT